MKDLSIVKKAINGNEKAFETLVKKESEKLYKTAFLYVRNKEDALDVLQETIYKAFISIEQVKQPQFFNTWLTKILIRTAYDVIRKRKKVVFDEELMRNISDDSSIDVEGKMDVLNAISGLSKNYQTVIILFYYHDCTIDEIAETMGKPANTIKTYLRRAKMELKKSIGGMNYHGQRAFT
ncbi:sigma-70 family RNA polymerase sigma factor [Gracilibacillus caseinilyticus]|uniref:Sigma-70 family RNA polymerase sigma factor n=1 Tax=Gracilibacillus caseinilyticus TaxID=2932256 RepID=A0ABY4F3E0_9BACI|nr:sigma-70 family RNA polymerase sigma factor [Gracilibacillus caseinilyticus]UOQ50399.1 sigma-70 family RNA polymerase sigma factor [Gracilibacillus caseinilyticus]